MGDFTPLSARATASKDPLSCSALAGQHASVSLTLDFYLTSLSAVMKIPRQVGHSPNLLPALGDRCSAGDYAVVGTEFTRSLSTGREDILQQ